MKKLLPMLAILFLGLAACSDSSDQENQSPPPAATETDKRTKVRIGEDGVKLETDKVEIDISKDSGSLQVED